MCCEDVEDTWRCERVGTGTRSQVDLYFDEVLEALKLLSEYWHRDGFGRPDSKVA